MSAGVIGVILGVVLGGAAGYVLGVNVGVEAFKRILIRELDKLDDDDDRADPEVRWKNDYKPVMAHGAGADVACNLAMYSCGNLVRHWPLQRHPGRDGKEKEE